MLEGRGVVTPGQAFQGHEQSRVPVQVPVDLGGQPLQGDELLLQHGVGIDGHQLARHPRVWMTTGGRWDRCTGRNVRGRHGGSRSGGRGLGRSLGWRRKLVDGPFPGAGGGLPGGLGLGGAQGDEGREGLLQELLGREGALAPVVLVETLGDGRFVEAHDEAEPADLQGAADELHQLHHGPGFQGAQALDQDHQRGFGQGHLQQALQLVVQGFQQAHLAGL